MKAPRFIRKAAKPLMGHPLTSLVVEILAVIPLALWALWVRKKPKPYDVGFGPEPLINSVYHKKALILYGYQVETFVMRSSFITNDFDFEMMQVKFEGFPLPPVWRWLALFVRALQRYRVLFIYFNGGPLFPTRLLRYIEPYYYKLAGIKIVVLPYGSDVQVMSRSSNLYFKHAQSMDYPELFKYNRRIAANVDRWIEHADWVFSGSDWVDYMYFWNTLQLGHYTVDLSEWRPVEAGAKDQTLRILHAPNHLHVKGSGFLLKAVEKLRAEGLDIELILKRGVSNHEIREAIASVDLVVDQFVVGCYATFAIEAMAMEKPVLCYLRQDFFEEFYVKAGLIEPGEVPIINTDPLHIEEILRWAYHHRDELMERGRLGRTYVQKHHSLESVGNDFRHALEALDIYPDRPRRPDDFLAVTDARDKDEAGKLLEHRR